MEQMTAGQAAERWGVTTRLVQRLCAQGRVEGAEKFGGSWRVPADAAKPSDLRLADAPLAGDAPASRADCSALMPLTNAAFAPGHAEELVASLGEGPRADVARAELAYFRGEAERACRIATPRLGSQDFAARLSACLICAFANLPLGRVDQARAALDEARGAVAAASERDPRLRAAEGFIALTASVLLHLPAPESLPEATDVLPALPPGLRAFAFYVQAHAVYLTGDWARSLGIAETALLMQGEVCPIPTIYLHMVAVMDLMGLRRTGEAREHLLAAWELARPDGLIEPLGEHHGLLGGMLEAVIKPAWPDDFRQIIDITYRFSAGWRRVHNPATGDDVADNLTTTEFAACMLAARGWTNAQIASHMGFSVNRVKECISKSLKKLGVSSRKELGRFLLS